MTLFGFSISFTILDITFSSTNQADTKEVE